MRNRRAAPRFLIPLGGAAATPPWGALSAFVNNVFDCRLFSPGYQLTDLPLQPDRQTGLAATYKD